jgi:molybdopterin/thiamine biosynthesis adenylyltransferase
VSAADPVRESVLVVGAGGVAHPAVIALASAGVRRIVICDDDVVERTNLHRQILFSEADVGEPKLDALAERAAALAGPSVVIETKKTRFLPSTALDLLDGVSVVLDACDNFATRFLVADAAHRAGVPSVHGAAVRWTATAMASPASGKPCYRCLFEDLPEGDAPDCATAGVVGPVCGVAGGLAAELVLRILRPAAGIPSAFGVVATFDGLTDHLRVVQVKPRPGCALCGAGAVVPDLAPHRYAGPSCDA